MLTLANAWIFPSEDNTNSMSRYFSNEYFYYLLILVAACFLCFLNLGGYPVYILDEAKNAEAAREMFVHHQFLIPTFNDELRTDKPPLHYWFMILSYKIFGVHAMAARFFSAFFGVLTLVSTYHFTKKFITRKMGLITTFLLCSAIFFIQEFHLAVPDPYLIFFVSFSLFNFYDYHENGKMSSWYFVYISIGLGILAKGPVALILPLVCMGVFLWFKKEVNFASLKKYKIFSGLVLTLLISAPWFIWIHFATDGAFTEGFFMQHNLKRFGGAMEGHGGLPFVTWAFVLLGLLPYSFFIVQGYYHAWKNRNTDSFVFFSFIVSTVFILFFSISLTKLPNYPMPCYPFLAVLIGYYIHLLLDQKVPIKGYKISLWVLLAITAMMPIAAYFALTKAEPQLYTVRYSSFLLAILPVGCLLSIVYVYRKKLLESVICIGFSSMFLSMELFSFIYPKLTQETPVMTAMNLIEPHEKILLYKGYDPSFQFNFQRSFPFTDDKNEVLKFSRTNPDSYIITKEKFYLAEFADVPTEIVMKQKALFENYTVVIFQLK